MNNIKAIFLFTLLFVVSIGTLLAQELRCNVQVNRQKVQGTDDQLYNAMYKSVYEFMNNTKFTGYTMRYDERIECSILITILERVSSDEFNATMTISARRPVYNTTYYSTLINWVDRNVHFNYTENEPIEFNESTYISNLSSLLAFYAYYIIGLDFDSFSKFGGTPFFEKAEMVLNEAQSSRESGWSSFDGNRNRYWLVENMTNNSFAAIREASYLYHREGLDRLWGGIELGRSKLVESVEMLKLVYALRPDLLALNLFLESKCDEIVNVFKEGTSTEKSAVANIMKEINPVNASKYDKINSRP